MLVHVKEDLRCSQADYCSGFTKNVSESFDDGQQCECSFIDYFVQCLRLDDIDMRPSAAGFQVFLPASLSVIQYSLCFSNSLFSNLSVVEYVV